MDSGSVEQTDRHVFLTSVVGGFRNQVGITEYPRALSCHFLFFAKTTEQAIYLVIEKLPGANSDTARNTIITFS